MSAKAAADPATDPARLAKLAAKYPAQVLHNPVLPLLLLEQPAWLEQLPAESLAALLRQPAAPATVAPALLTAALATQSVLAVRLALANSPATPPAVLAQLAHDAEPAVRHAVRYRADAPPPADPAPALRDTLVLGLPPFLQCQAPYAAELVEALVQLPGVVAPARLAWLRQPASAELQASQPKSSSYQPFSLPFERPLQLALRGRPDVPLALRLDLLLPLSSTDATGHRTNPPHTDTPDEELLASVLPALAGWAGPPAAATAAQLAALATHPGWLHQAVAGGHPAAPPALRRQVLAAATHPLVAQAVAANPAWTPDELRQLLANDRHRTRGPALLLGLAQNPHTPPDVLQAVLAATPATPTGWEVWHRLAQHPHLPAEAFAPLLEAMRDYAATHEPYARWSQPVAANPAAPPALLLWLALHAFAFELPDPTKPWLSYWLPALPTETVSYPPAVQLRPDAELRRHLAASPRLPAAWCALLLAYPHPLPLRLSSVEVLPLLAANPSTPPDLLAALANDFTLTTDLRPIVAANPAAPLATLREFAAGRALDLARIALRHPAYPAPAAADSDVAARRWRAIHEPAALAGLARDKDRVVRTLVAGHPAAPPATLAQLAADKGGPVRAAVAAHPATAPGLLAALARDPDSLVVREVAAHPAAPPALLADLARHDNKFVRRNAFANPHLPAEVLPELLKDKSLENRRLLLHRPDGRRLLLHRLADHDPTTALLLHLLLPDLLTDAHRAALAASPIPGHRLAVAHRPAFATQLRDDPHLLVRLVARGELALPELLDFPGPTTY